MKADTSLRWRDEEFIILGQLDWGLGTIVLYCYVSKGRVNVLPPKADNQVYQTFTLLPNKRLRDCRYFPFSSEATNTAIRLRISPKLRTAFKWRQGSTCCCRRRRIHWVRWARVFSGMAGRKRRERIPACVFYVVSLSVVDSVWSSKSINGEL